MFFSKPSQSKSFVLNTPTSSHAFSIGRIEAPAEWSSTRTWATLGASVGLGVVVALVVAAARRKS